MYAPAALDRMQRPWAEKLAESLIVDDRFFDAVAVLGPEQLRRPFLSALVANVSKPLGAALFGEFQEGRTKEVALVQMTPAAFECILRAAAGLKPKLSSQNVLSTLEAAKTYMIDELVDYCILYLKTNLSEHYAMSTLEVATKYKISELISHCTAYLKTKVGPVHLLTMLSTSAMSGFALPEDVEKSLWCKTLMHSEKVLSAPSFAAAHGSIIMRLVKLEEFGVDEEMLWSQLLAWSSKNASNPDLLGPMGNSSAEEPLAKRLKSDECNPDSGDIAQQRTILRYLSKHVRFCAMGREYFFDKARLCLTREISDSIMAFHMFGRSPSDLVTTKRSGLVDEEQNLSFCVRSSIGDEEVQRLPTGTAAWKPTPSCQEFEVQLEHAAQLTKVCLTFAGEGSTWDSPLFQDRSEEFMDPSRRSLGFVPIVQGQPDRVKTYSFEVVAGRPKTLKFAIIVAARRIRNFDIVAKLERVDVFGKLGVSHHASDVVNRLFADLSIVSPSLQDFPSSPT